VVRVGDRDVVVLGDSLVSELEVVSEPEVSEPEVSVPEVVVWSPGLMSVVTGARVLVTVWVVVVAVDEVRLLVAVGSRKYCWTGSGSLNWLTIVEIRK
jgi:hypothetical protein